MRMVKVDGHRVCLVRTAGGVHALDHACPHEGYGLTQGELNGDLLTCAWHNWKFRVTDGTCVQGEEGVTVHRVDVDDAGDIRVSITRPDPEVVRGRTLVSLRRGIEKDYTGQVARDVVRLLQASANPGELIWEAVAHGAPRAEFGWGHSIASATDCLTMVDLYEGDQRALPIVQGIVGIAESERDRPLNALPAPARGDEATLTRFRVGGRIRTDGRCAGARARRDRTWRHRGRSAAVVHRRGQRPSALVRPRRDLRAEGVRTPGDDRVGTGGDRAAAPRADARVRHRARTSCRTCGRSSVASIRSI